MIFQSTLPRRERLLRMPAGLHPSDFNPRSRVGSDLLNYFEGRCREDFNPRSRVGSDTYRLFPFIELSNFNPRSRVGSDQPRSIILIYIIYFNPRSRVGSDLICPMSGVIICKFQSTLPRRERLQNTLIFSLIPPFFTHLTKFFIPPPLFSQSTSFPL